MTEIGTKVSPEAADPSDAAIILVEHLKVFLRCGGTIGYAEFEELPQEAVAALARAAREIDIERALMLAEALRSAEGALRVAAGADGGDGLVRSKIMQAVDGYIRGRNGA